MFNYESIEDICREAEARGIRISEAVLDDQSEQLEKSREELFALMSARLDVMEQAVSAGLDPELRSTSGLTGGDAARLWARSGSGGMTGGFMLRSMARAMAVSENNAAMGRIVAAPTAGSCGILPGTVASLLAEGRCTREQAVMSLFTAGAFGMVIAQKASISGAEGGCQAECGAACAMAAAALVELMGGSPRQSADAAAMALKNQLGLVCDPVAGLVEIPCIKRNVAGVSIAFAAAEMALAGIGSRIPADECVDAMREVGEALPASLRETAKAGLAATPTGKRLREQVFGREE